MARADCSEWALKLNDYAIGLARLGKATDIESATKEMNRRFGLEIPIPLEMVRDAVANANEIGPRNLTETQKNIAEIKKDAKDQKKLLVQINFLQDALAKGEDPVSPGKSRRVGSDIAKKYRAVVDSLKRTVAKRRAQSEPSQVARLEKQIADAEAVIEKGDFTPKIKPERTRKSRNVERLEFNRDQLRRKIRSETNSLKSKSTFDLVASHVNIFRLFMTSGEASFFGRQGRFFLLSRPITTTKVLAPTFDAAISKKRSIELMEKLDERPNRPLSKLAELDLTEVEGSLTAREEDLQSFWAEKIPGIAASSRAYVVFLNTLRMDIFDIMIASLPRQGDVTIDDAKAIAQLINHATGRGSIGDLQKSATLVNAIFFALRFQVSRFQLLGGIFTLPFRRKVSRDVKLLIAKEYGRALTGAFSYYFLISMALSAMAFTAKRLFDDDDAVPESEIEIDSRSSNFGKIRIGKTLLDPLAGISQTVVLLTRLGLAGASGTKRFFTGTGFPIDEFKSAATGNFSKISGPDRGFGKADVQEVFSDFLRNRLSPVAGFAVNIFSGAEDFKGDPVTPKTAAVNMLSPITYGDIYETFLAQGIPVAVAISMMAFFGEGVQNWGQAWDEKSNKELRESFLKHTYKTSGRKQRTDKTTGRKFEVWRDVGDPLPGQEGRVAAIQAELSRRRGKR